MTTEPLRRPFKVFEAHDVDETFATLSRLFDGQKTFISRVASRQNPTCLSSGTMARSVLFHFQSTHDLLIEKKDAEDYITINLVLGGHLQVTVGTKGEIVSSAGSGNVLPMAENTKAVSTEYDGLGLLIPRSAIHEGLQALTGKPTVAPVDFDLVLHSGGRIVRDSIEMAARHFRQAQSPLDHAGVAARLEEFMIHALLHGQPHNYQDVIAGERWTASPKQVRRAEAHMRAHAEEPLRLVQIAAAAGCSIRALQLAFRTFRDTTPMAMLRQLRLDGVHAALSQSEPEATTVTAVAARFGFYNAHRFVQDYRKSFGQSPSETLRFGSTIRRAPSAADRPVATAMRRGDR